MNNLKFLQDFNLMIKTIWLIDEIPTKQRRLLIRTLVELWYIKNKVKKNEIVEILYKIKTKLIKWFDNKLKKIDVKTENVIVEDKIFQSKTLTQWKRVVKLHTKKETKEVKKIKEQIVLKKENVIREVKKEDIINKEKYVSKKKDKLVDKFIEYDKIDELLNVLKQKKKQKFF